MGLDMSRRTAVALLAAFLALGVGAVVAVAGVTVYANHFSSRADVKELKRVEGDRCVRRWRKKAEKLRIEVKRGREVCGYAPPVAGDSEKPDHDLRITGKLLKQTPKGARDGAYLAVMVRASRNRGYELRVFPTKHRYELRRSPADGGGGFPASGTDTAIKGIKKANTLKLKVVGDTVTAAVNGTKLAEVTDSNPGDVSGRRLEIAVGNKKRTAKPVLVVFDDLKVQVPKP